MTGPAPGKAELNMGGWVQPEHLSPEVKATGRTATFVVAASDSSARAKQQADYVCDGTADQAIINAALALCDVKLMKGHFYINTPIIMSDLFSNLSGVGHAWESGGTQIYLENGSDCNMIEMDGTAAHIFFPTISHLYLNGNRSNNASGYGIYCPSGDTVSDHKIYDVAVQNTQNDGIRILGGWYIMLHKVWCEYCGDGAYIGGKTAISQCVFSENYGKGITLGGNANISESFIQNNAEIGIYLTWSKGKIVNNRIAGNSKGNANIHSGIRVYGDADYTTIANNIIDGESTQKYGIELLSGVDYANIKDNTILGNVTKSILITAGVNANGQIRDNIGFVTENSSTATLVNGQTSIAVAHGLAVTPVAGDIMVTPMESLGNASFFWIDTYTATQFTIHADINPGQDVDFAWKAVVL